MYVCTYVCMYVCTCAHTYVCMKVYYVTICMYADGSLCTAADIAARQRTVRPTNSCSIPGKNKRDLSSPKHSDRFWCQCSPFLRRTGALSLEIKRLGTAADSSCPDTANVKNKWTDISTFLHTHPCSVKHKLHF